MPRGGARINDTLISVKLPQTLVDSVDEAVADYELGSRSELIRIGAEREVRRLRRQRKPRRRTTTTD